MGRLSHYVSDSVQMLPLIYNTCDDIRLQLQCVYIYRAGQVKSSENKPHQVMDEAPVSTWSPRRFILVERKSMSSVPYHHLSLSSHVLLLESITK